MAVGRRCGGGPFRENVRLGPLWFVPPERARCRDCFVALRAPRNDGVGIDENISAVIASEAKQSRSLR
jgi:hypothetical protein